MNYKRLVKLGLALVVPVMLAGCSTTNEGKDAGDSGKDKGKADLAQEQVFKTVVGSEMPTADPTLSTDVISSVALNSVYEGLYRFDGEGKAQPAGAAEMAEVSDDGLVYTFKLREDAKWSDGEPVVAKDYVYAWQRAANPDSGSEYAFFMENLKNGGDVINGDKPVEELGVKALSDYELEVTLEKPTPYFDYLVAFSTFYPQRQDIVEKYGKDYASTSDKAVYNGPFTLADFDGPGTDTEWAYEKNDTYWDKDAVKLDKVEVQVIKEASTALNLYQDGQAEDVVLTGELAQQMASDPDFVTDKKASMMYLEMNQSEDDGLFKNENVRKALSYTIDREALVEQILGDGSIAPTGLVPSGMVQNIDGKEHDFAKESGDFAKFDLDKAKEHWEKAKKELGKDKLSFDILTSDTDSAKKVSEYLQGTFMENLDGLDVTVSPVTFTIRIERGLKQDFDMLNSGWNADYNDPSSFIDLFASNISYNQGKYSNPEYDKLVKSAAVDNANDPAARWQDLLDAEKILMDEMGLIPLYQKAEAHLRTAKVKDVVVNPAGAPYDYKWAYKVD
ncbi:peptide ABC transporter substrate-binding protein [Vagococcus lutrae]|uniref:peptide ABC transporter substrate-binding protein n=1 Tax=Vagococcus lutrae TaxID=81947 RepID=UPI001925FBEC|nr:peptide ABC transporter substrate-binding protein [Vagococcus lutrae]MDO5742456.1 peptide ABC transporter substrate-binding protein [Vagococcus sp.]MDT2813150.1 peptide ABC transporter substrate-binding protein [Vagococcus lutrae]MDT2820017.1 peptide ABC transporter substrate-binding protein [Vagococcus lutrae]MDT2844934.1 peptide ABC transporter substrate-binding protein [Vagococcus lutrae]WCG04982.1 peptide ABC transporter substrate-binding protein [Vagococcus lutrae]